MARHTHACMQTCTCTCMHTHTHTHIRMHTHTHTHAHTHTHTHARTHTYICTTHTHTYRTHARTHAHAHAHTHTCTICFRSYVLVLTSPQRTSRTAAISPEASNRAVHLGHWGTGKSSVWCFSILTSTHTLSDGLKTQVSINL